MKISGFVNHHKDCIIRLIKRTGVLSEKYGIKFKKRKKEDYGWKIENFQKLHVDFYYSKEKIVFSVLLKFLNEVMLKEPFEVKIDDDCISFGYYTTAEQFGSTNDNEGFGVFVVQKDKVLEIEETGR